jgi:glycosyltransferase involved in cell wall biosynthesis
MTDTRPHVVMAVAERIALDSRVRKTARAVRDMGYRVTLLSVEGSSGEVVEGELDGVRTIGVPVPYYLSTWARNRDLAAAERRVRTFGVGYPGPRARRIRAAQLAAREARLGGETAGPGLKLAQAIHRARSKALSVATDRRERRLEQARRGRTWQEELAHIADLEGIFTPLMAELKPDVLHMHDIHLLGAGVNVKRRLRAAGRDVKLIYDAHEYVQGQAHRNPYLSLGYARMEQDLIGEADGMVTVSDAIADRVTEDYALGRRPTVTVNAPPRAAGLGAGDGVKRVREVTGLPEGTPLVVYSGGLSVNRKIDALIDSMAELPGVHLAVICVPNTKTKAAQGLAEHVAGLEFADRVHLIEPVEPEQVVDYLVGCSVGINAMSTEFLNHHLTLPNKLFDYIWAGVPVAVSDVQSMAGIVRDTGTGTVFDPADTSSIAGAIREVLDNHERYVAATRDPAVRERYSWETQMAGLADLYDSLVGPGEAES